MRKINTRKITPVKIEIESCKLVPQKAPSQMFDWVLNTLLKILSKIESRKIVTSKYTQT